MTEKRKRAPGAGRKPSPDFDSIPAAEPTTDEDGNPEPCTAEYLCDVRNDLRSAIWFAASNLKQDITDCDTEETRADCQRLLDWLKTAWETLP